MEAGESAWIEGQRRRRSAERHAGRSESLNRSAAAFEKGAAGEAITSAVLDRLVTEGWLRLDDRRWPSRVRANIDHIVVGPGGVFVIDTKNWSARPAVRGGILYAGGYRKEREVAAAADAALAVAELLPAPACSSVTPVICFVSNDEIAGVARDVLVCSTMNLPLMLRSRPSRLSEDQVADTALALTSRMYSAAGPTAVAGGPRRRGPKPARTARRSAGPRPGHPPRGKGRGLRREVLRLLLLATLALFLIVVVLPALMDGVVEGILDTAATRP